MTDKILYDLTRHSAVQFSDAIRRDIEALAQAPMDYQACRRLFQDATDLVAIARAILDRQNELN